MVEGELASQRVDALLRPVQSDLAPMPGHAEDLLEAAGPALREPCERIGSVEVGEAVATAAGALPARLVIHASTAAPDGHADAASVRAAMRRSLELAASRGCRSLALPALGAGERGLALQHCAEILVEEARRHLEARQAGEAASPLEEVRFVLSGEPAYRVFEMVHDAAKVAAQMERLRSR